MNNKINLLKNVLNCSQLLLKLSFIGYFTWQINNGFLRYLDKFEIALNNEQSAFFIYSPQNDRSAFNSVMRKLLRNLVLTDASIISDRIT